MKGEVAFVMHSSISFHTTAPAAVNTILQIALR